MRDRRPAQAHTADGRTPSTSRARRPVRRRIGVSMRVARAPDYDEERDALAHDWPRFLDFAAPDALWLPLPNLGPAVIDLVRGWRLDAFILTGGNDIGESDRRDATESALLEHAIDHGRPVFAVCRGLQLTHVHLGGTLRPCEPADHVATRHAVTLLPGRESRVVNSFHHFGIAGDAPPRDAHPLATTDDGWLEAVHWPRLSITGVMWHPEREPRPVAHDRALLRRALGLP